MLSAGLIAAAAIGLGDTGSRRASSSRALRLGERLALDYGVGTAILGVLTLLAGRSAGSTPVDPCRRPCRPGDRRFLVARPWQIRPPEDTGTNTRVAGLAWSSRRSSWRCSWGRCCPTIDFDVLEYHLQGPKEYYQAGRIAYLPHNVYTNMPFGVEMLHLLGMEVYGDWWWGALAGQLLVAAFAPAAAVLIASTAGSRARPARPGSPRSSTSRRPGSIAWP